MKKAVILLFVTTSILLSGCDFGIGNDKSKFNAKIEQLRAQKKNDQQKVKSVGLLKDAFSSDTLKVQVICNLPAAIEVGNYDRVSDQIISTNFPEPSCKDGQAEITLVGMQVTLGEALAELDKLGLRPATLPELLALGSAYPDLQERWVITALGSRLQGPNGGIYFPILHWDEPTGRGVELDWLVPDGAAYYSQFAAVPK